MDSRFRGNDPSIWPMHHRSTQGIAKRADGIRPTPEDKTDAMERVPPFADPHSV